MSETTREIERKQHEQKALKEINNITNWICGVVAVAGLMVIGGLCFVTSQHSAKQPDVYKAWCKHTGNPGQLTFDEWLVLPKHYK